MAVEQRSGLDRRAPWTDQTIRPPGEPEIDYNPESQEFELSWTYAGDITGRLTILVPTDVLDRMTVTAREQLDILPSRGALIP